MAPCWTEEGWAAGRVTGGSEAPATGESAGNEVRRSRGPETRPVQKVQKAGRAAPPATPGPPPSGMPGCAAPVLLMSAASSRPGPGGPFPAGALSARVACTWASARIRRRRMLSCSVRACAEQLLSLWRGARGRCSSWPPVAGVSADGMTYPDRWPLQDPCSMRKPGQRVTGLGGCFSSGNQSAARVAFPAVPGHVGELDADGVDAVADVFQLVPELLRNLDKAVSVGGGRTRIFSMGPPRGWGSQSAPGTFSMM